MQMATFLRFTIEEMGEQLVSMEVMDPFGGFCGVNIGFQVGVPPIITLRSPELSDVVTLNDIVNLWVDVADLMLMDSLWKALFVGK